MSVGPIFGILGGVLALVALLLLLRVRRFLGKAQATTGMVVQMAYSSSSDGGGGYSAVYQFRSMDGQTIVKQDSLSTNPPRFKVGQQIKVLYQPDDPNKAYIDSWMSLYFLPALLGGIGLIFAGTAIVMAAPQIIRTLGF